MTDKVGVVAAKSRRPEDMVGVNVGEDHISDRLFSTDPDCCSQRFSLGITPAGVDHRHRLVAEDEADIRDPVLVRR